MTKQILFLLALSFPAHAQDLGKKIDLLKNEKGLPKIGLQYALSPDAHAGITLSMSGNQFLNSKPGNDVPPFTSIIDKKTGKSLIDWHMNNAPAGDLPLNATVPLTIEIDTKREVRALTESLKDAVLVFSYDVKTDNFAITHHFDLGEICKIAPAQILNLDTMKTGCGK